MNNIDNIVDSIEGMKRAEPSANFTQDVIAKWKGKIKTVPMRTVWSVAAAIAILIAVNVWVGVNYKSANTSQQASTIEDVVSDYGLSNKVFSY